MPLSLRAGMALRILERAPLVVVVLDGEGRLRHSNQFFHELSGYSPAELAGLPFAHLGLALPATELARATDSATARTATMRTKAGERRHLEWTDAFDVEGDDGSPLTVRVARDVTAQEAAFEALTVSEQRLAEAHRVAQIGAWELDLHTGRVWWSDEQRRIHGVAPDTPITIALALTLVHPDDRLRVDEARELALATGVSEVKFRIVRPDGGTRLLHGRGRVLTDAAGRPARLVGTSQDITERRRLHERLQQAQSLAHVGSWEHDMRTDTCWWADETFRILGLEPGVQPPAFDLYVSAIHPDDRQTFEMEFARPLTSGPLESRHRLVLPTGETRHVRSLRHAVLDGDGRPVMVEGALQDVTALVESEQRLRRVLDAVHAWISVCAPDGRLVDITTPPLGRMGLDRTDVMERPFWDLPCFSGRPDTIDRIRHAHLRAVAGESTVVELQGRTADGAPLWLETTFAPLRSATGALDGVVVSAADLTERRRAEQAARHTHELLQAVLAAAPVAIVDFDAGGQVRHAEGRIFDVARPGRDPRTAARAFFAAAPGFHARLSDAAHGLSPVLLTRVGAQTIETVLAPRYDGDGAVEGVVGVSLDVTGVVRAQEQLRDREARLATVFNHASEGMLLLDVLPPARLRVAAANDSFLRPLRTRFAIEEAALLGRGFDEVMAVICGRSDDQLRQYHEAVTQVLATREPGAFESTTRLAASSRIERVSIIPILDAAGRCVQLLWTVRDITARRQQTQLLRASLAEKDILLREVHHRVKNNLQVVTGLLHFHAKRLRSPEEAATLDELRRRIIAMTLVHERLYQSRDVARVDLRDYTSRLIAELRRSFAPRDDVQLHVQVEAVTLPIEVALPCGMIVCELVTNVLKHGFPAGRGGDAHIVVRRTGDQVELRVDDNGIGFPPDFDWRTSETFGWELLKTLALQIDGALEVTAGDGAHVRVSFPVPKTQEVGA